jgi:hypothetical protein
MDGRRFTVAPAQVKQGGATACELAEQLTEARRAWAQVADDPGDALGYAELTAGYEKMENAWFAEFGVYIEVLSELCAKLQTSAAAYSGVEDRAAGRYGTPT